MSTIIPKYRQSNKDLCLQAYGTLDLLVKFCKNNGVPDINIPKSSLYQVDDNLIQNVAYTGYPYATMYIPDTADPIIPPDPDKGFSYITQYGEGYISQDSIHYIEQ